MSSSAIALEAVVKGDIWLFAPWNGLEEFDDYEFSDTLAIILGSFWSVHRLDEASAFHDSLVMQGRHICL